MTKEMKNVAVGAVVLDERNETLWVVEKKEGKFKTVMMHNRINKEEVVTVTYATFKKHFTVLAAVAELMPKEDPEVVEEVVEKAVKTRHKKTFEELVAMLPAVAGVEFKKRSNGGVAVKFGNKTLFSFSTSRNAYTFRTNHVDLLKQFENAVYHEHKNDSPYITLTVEDPKIVIDTIMANR